MAGIKSRVAIGVMGSSAAVGSDREALAELARRLGRTVAQNDCVLVTGATTGLPHLVSCAAREHGGLTIGVSPAISRAEHRERFRLPDDGADVILYTGFGLKGRNIINVRASDIVIILGGGIGTLNEFTIAYDEEKIIGVLEGSGGIVDIIRSLPDFATKEKKSALVFDSSPESLVTTCLRKFKELD